MTLVSIDLFSLYVLFSQYRSCDNTLENCFFQITVNPLLSPPGGLFFSSTFEGGGGLNREEGLKREGGAYLI